jgi:hypothetical protein
MRPFVGEMDLFQAESTPGILRFIHCIEKVRKRESVGGSFHLYSDIHLKPGPATATLDPWIHLFNKASFSPNSHSEN